MIRMIKSTVDDFWWRECLHCGGPAEAALRKASGSSMFEILQLKTPLASRSSDLFNERSIAMRAIVRKDNTVNERRHPGEFAKKVGL